MNADTEHRGIGLAAHVGTGMGFVGWVVGLGGVLAADGDGATAWRLLPVATLLSLALWLATAVAIEGAFRAFGRTAADARLVLFGMLATSVGTLALLLHHVVLPELVARPDTLDLLRATRSALGVPWPLREGALALGVLLLARPAWRLARGALTAR